MLGLYLVVSIAMRVLPFGRMVYAVGGNRRAGPAHLGPDPARRHQADDDALGRHFTGERPHGGVEGRLGGAIGGDSAIGVFTDASQPAGQAHDLAPAGLDLREQRSRVARAEDGGSAAQIAE